MDIFVVGFILLYVSVDEVFGYVLIGTLALKVTLTGVCAVVLAGYTLPKVVGETVIVSFTVLNTYLEEALNVEDIGRVAEDTLSPIDEEEMEVA